MISASSFETVVLDQLAIGIRQMLPERSFLADSFEMQTYADHFAFNLVCELRAKILAEKLPRETVEQFKELPYEVPATWWQHFKMSHPTLTRRLHLKPARMETKTKMARAVADLERYWAYPEAKRIHADFGQPIRTMMVRSVEWNWES